MNGPCFDKSTLLVEGNANIPTRSGCLLKKLSLCLCAYRTRKWNVFLSTCIAFIVCLCLGCPTRLCAAEKLNFLDYETALQIGKDTHRPLLLFFTTPWCYYCKEMERKVFQNKDITAILNERFLLVEVDISQEKKLKENFRINYTPTSVFLDVHGKPIMDVKGYILTEKFRKLLRFVSEGHYKKITFSDFDKK